MKELAYDLRPMPVAFEAEEALLGCCVCAPGSIAEVRSLVHPEAFYSPAHQALADAIFAMDDANETVDVITLPIALKQRKVFDLVGGWNTIQRLTDTGAASWNIGHYAKTVNEEWQRRSLIEACRQTIDQAFDNCPIEELLSRHQVKVEGLADVAASEAGYSSEELFDAVSDAIQNGKTLDYLETGEEYFDAKLKVARGYLVVYCGRPSMGKTARAIKTALRWALPPRNYKGHVYTLEQPKEELAHRKIACLSGLPLTAITEGTLTPAQKAIVQKATDRLRTLPIRWFEDPDMTVAQIRSRAIKAKRRGGLDFIIIDQLNRLETGKRDESENQRCSLLMRQLKNLARSLDVAVIILVQLNRDVEKRGNKRPQLSDLRDSGNIEAEASIVCASFRQSFYDAQEDGGEEPTETDAEFGIIKYQNGKTGIIHDRYCRSTQRFFRYDTAHEDPQQHRQPEAPTHGDEDALIIGTAAPLPGFDADYSHVGDARAGR